MEDCGTLNLNETYRLVYQEDGSVLLNGNNIVVQHRITNEIGYLENTAENRAFFNISIMDNADEPDLDIVEDQEERLQASSDEHWTDAETKNLIALYSEDIEKFRNPKIKKKEMWRSIASHFETKNADSCDKKFRNLKQHYIYILKKKKKTGRGAVKWPYFDILHQLFQNDANINPEKEINIVQTLPCEKENIDPQPSTSSTSAQEETITGHAHSQKNTPRKRKRNEDLEKIMLQSQERQVKMEEKIDKLLGSVTESNKIQTERNKLLETYINLYRNKE